MTIKHLGITLLILIILCSCNLEKGNNERDLNIYNHKIDSLLELASSNDYDAESKLESNEKAYKLIVKSEIPDSIKIKYFFRVANRFYNLNNYDKYRVVSQNIIEKSVKTKDTVSLTKGYAYLGDYYYKKAIGDSALIYYLKADKFSKKIDKMKSFRIENLISMARVKSVAHDFTGAEILVTEALLLLKDSEDYQNSYEAYTILGYLSNEVKNYQQSLDAHNKALNIVTKYNLNNAQHQAAASLNNIGNVYQSLNLHQKAILHFNRGLRDENLKVDRPDLYALLIDNIAYSNFKLKKYSNVLKDYNTALRIRDSLKSESVILSLIRISEYYAEIQDTSQSIKMARLAWKTAESTSRNIDKLMVLRQLLSVDKKNSPYISEKYIAITDSLQQAERKIKDKFARIQFETQEISQENDKLNAQNRNLVVIFCGILMIGLLLFVIRTQRAKNRELMLKQAQQKANEDIYNLMISQQNKIEEGRIREKKRIAQEIHDGVLGRLFGARLNLDSLSRVADPEAREKTVNYLNELKNIEQDLREISHDLNREKTVLINNFVAILNNLFEDQSNNFKSELEVDIDSKIRWENVNNNLKINIYRIFQEGLQNINKYANASLIKVGLNLEGENLKLTIEDNGVGFSVDKKKSGIGLQNMESRTWECGGKFKITSEKGKGTRIKITFPIQEVSGERVALGMQPIWA